MLVQTKGWTAVVLASLAIGIGANTALFSAVNGLLLRQLPVGDPDSLVRFRSVGPNEMRTDTLVYGFTAPTHADAASTPRSRTRCIWSSPTGTAR
jgi:hypothetical protein